MNKYTNNIYNINENTKHGSQESTNIYIVFLIIPVGYV